MKEFFQELLKQKASLLIIAGILFLILGITSGLHTGTVSLSIEPAYRILSIISGFILITIGIVLAWKDSSDSTPSEYRKGKYSTKGDELSLLIEKASHVDALGYSLRTLIHNGQNNLINAVKGGASIRLIVIDPDGKSIQVMKAIKPETGIAKDIIRSLEIAQIKIQEQVQQSAVGRFEIRVIDWIPSCSLLILNSSSDNALMEVGYFPPNYKKTVGHKLHLYFSKKKDKAQFDEYLEEFNELWAMAKPYELSKQTAVQS
jgi:hypothetical protein